MATTVSMASTDIIVEDMTVERSLHCKYVSSPRRLSLELKDLLGAGQYKVEMRHNVYNIRAAKDFDVTRLMSRCQYRPKSTPLGEISTNI